MSRWTSQGRTAARKRQQSAIALAVILTSLSALSCSAPHEGSADHESGKEASAWSEEGPMEQEPGPTTDATIPVTGSGTFTTASDSLDAVGPGTPRRYRVQVEDSLVLSPSKAALEVNDILADPRGWTADGNGFQLVASQDIDFTVKIATPSTVDAICGAAGLDTQGKVNCTVGSTVVVNLRRWMLGSPQFDGPIEEYRALIINHEVGHRLGRSHEGCPGRGKRAPAMMQQIKGLDGCKANAWPYDSKGRYIKGPPVDRARLWGIPDLILRFRR
ncbi:DUF3152 domain-containing protein [Streptomyces sp. NBC_00568]|uniref:DUF3152 domain-containing protein n=1 Tax=Streptomyces sp. NBC_00568 TaxID=2975779 RepID=UPI00224E1D6A|nr:DUF3152 domain-containing protein [Streptomyces sp. NBC_00568]MCX4993634.1 DUF3152 domain-containing protein [Streptomyces sp. NBC_00568]